MDKRKQTLDTLAEMIDNLERLDISFLAGEEKAECEYAINETILDIQEVEGIIEPPVEVPSGVEPLSE
jgi:hypothetical protein